MKFINARKAEMNAPHMNTSPAELEPHPLALIFPAYTDAQMMELVADLGRNGMNRPIDLYEGKVLDGWNRRQAAIKAGMASVPTVEYLGDNPRAYVIFQNYTRRHLTDDQRAMIAAKFATMARGAMTDLPQVGGKSLGVSAEAAAAKMKVPLRTVERAKAVNKADPLWLRKWSKEKPKFPKRSEKQLTNTSIATPGTPGAGSPRRRQRLNSAPMYILA